MNLRLGTVRRSSPYQTCVISLGLGSVLQALSYRHSLSVVLSHSVRTAVMVCQSSEFLVKRAILLLTFFRPSLVAVASVPVTVTMTSSLRLSHWHAGDFGPGPGPIFSSQVSSSLSFLVT